MQDLNSQFETAKEEANEMGKCVHESLESLEGYRQQEKDTTQKYGGVMQRCEQEINAARELTKEAQLRYESTLIHFDVTCSNIDDIKARRNEMEERCDDCKKKADTLNFFNGGLGYDRENDAKTYNVKEDYQLQDRSGIYKPLSKVLRNRENKAQLGTLTQTQSRTANSLTIIFTSIRQVRTEGESIINMIAL